MVVVVTLQVATMLNNELDELLAWCRENSLFPHPKKCEAMLLHRGSFSGLLLNLSLGDHNIEWVSQSRLLGVTIDNKLTWSRHIQGVKKAFVNKLNLIKRSRFLPKSMLLDLYFKIICLVSLTHCLFGVVIVTRTIFNPWSHCIAELQE